MAEHSVNYSSSTSSHKFPKQLVQDSGGPPYLGETSKREVIGTKYNPYN